MYVYNTDIVRSADKKAPRLYSYYTMPLTRILVWTVCMYICSYGVYTNTLVV